MDISCSFSIPLNATGTPPVGAEFWQYSTVVCNDHRIALIENGEGQSFYIDQQISYGDFLITTIILLAFMIWIVKLIWDFIVPLSMKILTKNNL